jgi:hypothetical protein
VVDVRSVGDRVRIAVYLDDFSTLEEHRAQD